MLSVNPGSVLFLFFIVWLEPPHTHTREPGCVCEKFQYWGSRIKSATTLYFQRQRRTGASVRAAEGERDTDERTLQKPRDE